MGPHGPMGPHWPVGPHEPMAQLLQMASMLMLRTCDVVVRAYSGVGFFFGNTYVCVCVLA
jgi:hypothetical protein